MTNINFDTQSLLREINTVLNNGVEQIVKDFMERHYLLEQTHETLINLPSIKEYYDTRKKLDVVSEVNTNIESGFEYVIKESNDKLIKNIDNRINDILILNNELFNKLLIQIDELKSEINDLKIEKPKGFSDNEKENIKLEILDIKEDFLLNEAVETEDGEGDEEEDETEEVLEEDVKIVEEDDIVSVETETKESDEEDEEFIEIEIDDITYCTNDEENGIIYELYKDGNVGKKVGVLKDGDAYFD
jgi:hypothetical protein